jgi:hypothetical protein
MLDFSIRQSTNNSNEGTMDQYKIVRMYFKGGKRTIETGLTLEQAQEHCSDPETSSSTAKGSRAKRRTRERGQWFDGYEKQ